MPKRVEVVLGKDGSVRIEAFGFKGTSCTDATQCIRDALGVENTHDNTVKKASYYETETEAVVNGLPGGYCG